MVADMAEAEWVEAEWAVDIAEEVAVDMVEWAEEVHMEANTEAKTQTHLATVTCMLLIKSPKK
jgi:hypothetical protein